MLRQDQRGHCERRYNDCRVMLDKLMDESEEDGKRE